MNKKIIGIICVIISLLIASLVVVNNIGSSTKIKTKVYYIEAGIVRIENLDRNDMLITNYSNYKQLIDKYGIEEKIKESEFNDYDYLALFLDIDRCGEQIEGINQAELKGDTIEINFDISSYCGGCMAKKELFLVRFDKNSINNYKRVNIDYNIINSKKCDLNVEYKPVIYLYPEKEITVSVKLSNPENLLVTYPKYNNGWNVVAHPNGDLVDVNGRTYYALYWEGLTYNIDNNITEGFVVKGEDTISFLEEKLALLGLNERESNEFIMYWLPQLKNNKYNYIRFATENEINSSMELNITPPPDNIIRILMVFKPLNEEIEVKQQQINTPSRNGFTVVEWGGTKIN